MAHRSKWVIGVDLGDRESHICRFNSETGEIQESTVKMTRSAVRKAFSAQEARLVTLEVGGHSRWFSQELESMGFEVLVADARQLPLISKSNTKNDKSDALLLAKLGAADIDLLHPVKHRSDRAQMDLAIIKSRDLLIGQKTALSNRVKGVLKSFGHRLGKLASLQQVADAKQEVPEGLQPALWPLLDQLSMVLSTIKEMNRQIEALCEKRYPETGALLQVRGVGFLTALAFVLILEDPHRFPKSREVGSYLGLRPRQSDSGQLISQLGITKAGDTLLRRLLVGAAQYILGSFGEDCDLRRWGLTLAERGGKNAKKRAAVAVARKLSVLLHRLWITQDEYQPLRNASREKSAA